MRAFLLFAAIVCLAFIVVDRVLADDLIDLSDLNFADIHQAAYYMASHIGVGGISDVTYDGIVTFDNGTVMKVEI